MNVAGPYLICTPLSTLANWVQEFQRLVMQLLIAYLQLPLCRHILIVTMLK